MEKKKGFIIPVNLISAAGMVVEAYKNEDMTAALTLEEGKIEAQWINNDEGEEAAFFITVPGERGRINIHRDEVNRIINQYLPF